VVVILSTHIVADVTDLCSRMAIIHQGRIIVEGRPEDLTGSLKGRIWRRVVPKEALADLQQRYSVISNRLHAGQTIVHVLADRSPGAEFEAVDGGVEDLYFASVNESRRQAAA
jgi:ABC-type multidrug transport system ATPase subunit